MMMYKTTYSVIIHIQYHWLRCLSGPLDQDEFRGPCFRVALTLSEGHAVLFLLNTRACRVPFYPPCSLTSAWNCWGRSSRGMDIIGMQLTPCYISFYYPWLRFWIDVWNMWWAGWGQIRWNKIWENLRGWHWYVNLLCLDRVELP